MSDHADPQSSTFNPEEAIRQLREQLTAMSAGATKQLCVRVDDALAHRIALAAMQGRHSRKGFGTVKEIVEDALLKWLVAYERGLEQHRQRQ